MAVFPRNNALYTNPPGASEQLSTQGSSWLFAVTAIFGVALLINLTLTALSTSSKRHIHHLLTPTLFTALLTYYASASDLAWSPIVQSTALSHSVGPTRQIFWAKYILWSVAFPTITALLGLVGRVPWSTVGYQVVLAWVWVLSLLVAGFTGSLYKWGFFGFGLVAEGVLAWGTLFPSPAPGNTSGGVRRGEYLALAGAVNFLWVLYPLAWGLTDGGNYLGVTPGFIWFGILDLLLIVGVGFAVVGLAGKWDDKALGFASTPQQQQQTGILEKETGGPVNGGEASV
ncbi:uncharacterized protein C8A04DRAFT_25720 [Dichotomopilus funicola]|uniref:Rhodopsin n=1 Tax=Dichotomopilus funicola TaxID=1934379 RepID=A0AAN6V8N4_9PEZI|nr:hypothetical protein C8A04DRAFT_25720 [Dichotomopilus funicola]